MYDIKSIIEKPSQKNAKSNLAVVGRYVFTPEIFSKIEKLKTGIGKEIQITDAIADLMNDQAVYGYIFEGQRFDCGSKLGYLKATIEYALEHKELSKEFRNYLKKIRYLLENNLKKNFTLLDIGAADGANNKWNIISKKSNIILVEPHEQSAQKLKNKGFNVIESVLSSEDNKEIILVLENKQKKLNKLKQANFFI